MDLLAFLLAAVTAHGLFLMVRRWHGRPFGRLGANLLGPIAGAIGLFVFVLVAALHASYLESLGTGATVNADRFVQGLGPSFVLGWFSGFFALRRESKLTPPRDGAADCESADLTVAKA